MRPMNQQVTADAGIRELPGGCWIAKKRRGRAIDASWIEMETPDEGWSRSPEHQVKAGGKPGDGKRTLGRRAIPDQ
ncbi:MAG: hypothetical protein JAY72_00125 [Candidatus Thiodiazotropha endolucinida]|nr:hypothetical protein [Candidatus Thiodiazotropha taylori]MCW4320058.1 hypothetical protein [Candidatus Thiodiazotropha taylori]